MGIKQTHGCIRIHFQGLQSHIQKFCRLKKQNGNTILIGSNIALQLYLQWDNHSLILFALETLLHFINIPTILPNLEIAVTLSFAVQFFVRDMKFPVAKKSDYCKQFRFKLSSFIAVLQ